MAKICDNKSVGEIIRKDGKIVMIERLNYPEAFALPAGHCDGMSFEMSAIKESKEEVGVDIQENKMIWRGDLQNLCKREGGTHHFWEVFEAIKWSGKLKEGDDAKRFFLVTEEELRKIAERTEYFIKKYNISHERIADLTLAIFGDPSSSERKTDPEWKENPGLEPAWYSILKKIKFI